MLNPPKTFFLTLSHCIMVAGEMCAPGSIIEVLEHEAKDLLSRAKAKFATEDDVKNAIADDAVAVVSSVPPAGVPNGYTVSSSSGKWGWVKGDGKTEPEAMAGPFDTEELAVANAVEHASKAAA